MQNPETEVIFITGASRGIGRLIATSFASAGVSRMCLIARSEKDLRVTAANCVAVNPQCEGQILIQPLDVCDTTVLSQAVEACVAKFGLITTAVHNVGLHGLHSAVSAPLEEIDKNIEVNLLSVIHASRLVLPHLVKAQETQQTRSIFVSSALAQKWAMAPGWTSYRKINSFRLDCLHGKQDRNYRLC